MLPAIETLVFIAILGIAVLIYQWLIHSSWFSRLIDSITHPSPESDRDVLNDLDHAEEIARRCAKDAKATVAEAQRTVSTIKRRVRRV